MSIKDGGDAVNGECDQCLKETMVYEEGRCVGCLGTLSVDRCSSCEAPLYAGDYGSICQACDSPLAGKKHD